MKTVGIKQLKARLSEYVRRVRQGEVILVTDRDEIVAELHAPGGRAAATGELDEVLERLAASGAMTRPAHSSLGWTWKAQGLGLKAGSAQALLDEQRADRE